MNFTRLFIMGASMVAITLSGSVFAQDMQRLYVRIAELEVDPAQLERFTAATKEVGQTSVREEPGCLVLYAVAEKDNPGRVRVLEIYRDPEAYKAHLQTTHFQKFRTTTDSMVKSRRLIDAVALSLAAKEK
jgi:quinol monooxygenase YgiN